MAAIEVEGFTLELDDNGFLKEPDKWNSEVGKALAKLQNLDQLTGDHWKVINYIRAYYQEFSVPPQVKKLCKRTGVDVKRIYELFPEGPIKGACRVAGLPQSTGCV